MTTKVKGPMTGNLGDIECNSIRPEYESQETISGSIAFRVDSENDNYLRFCKSKDAIRRFLQVEPGLSEFDFNVGESLDTFLNSGKFRIFNTTTPPTGYTTSNDFLIEVSSIGDPIYLKQVLKDVVSHREYKRSNFDGVFGEWQPSGPTYTKTTPIGFTIPDGYNSYNISIYNTSSDTMTLPSSPMIDDIVSIKKIRSIGELTISANNDIYQDTNFNPGFKTFTIESASILSFIFDGNNWVLLAV